MLAGTIAKHCVGSLHRGQRLASWLQLWALYTALVFSSANPQPMGCPHPGIGFHTPYPQIYIPNPSNAKACKLPMGCEGTALCLLLLGRDRNQVGNSSGFNKYILTSIHWHHKLCEKPG